MQPSIVVVGILACLVGICMARDNYQWYEPNLDVLQPDRETCSSLDWMPYFEQALTLATHCGIDLKMLEAETNFDTDPGNVKRNVAYDAHLIWGLEDSGASYDRIC